MITFWLLLSTIIIVFSTYYHIKKTGFQIWDPFLIFICFFLLYSILGETYKVKADVFSNDVYIFSSFLVFVASTGILFGILISNKIKVKESISSNFKYNKSFVNYMAYAVALVGYIFMWMYYDRFGGMLEFISSGNRIERNELVRSTFGNYPFVNVILSGFVLSIMSGVLHATKVGNSNFKLIIVRPLLIVLPLLMFHVIDAERSHLIKYILIIFTIYGAYFGIKHKRRVVFTAIVLFVTFSLIGVLRGPLNLYLNGQTEASSAYLSRIVKLMPRSVIPNEFAAVQASLHYIVDKNYPLEYGATYIQSFEYLVPRSFFPYKKTPTLGDRIGDSWGKELFDSGRSFGLGISPISEAYLNFGSIGVYFYFILIAYFFSRLRRKISELHIPTLGFYLVSVFISLAIFRSAFASIFSYLFYMYIFINLPMLMVKILTFFKGKLDGEKK